MDSSGAGEVNMCNVHKDSEEDGELSKREEEQEEEQEEEEEEEDEKETIALLTPTVNGGLTGKRQKSSKRRVQWNDCNGKKLVDVIEFEPSDPSDSEDDSSNQISALDRAFMDCVRFCCCLGGRSSQS